MKITEPMAVFVILGGTVLGLVGLGVYDATKPKPPERHQKRVCDAAAQERIFLACMGTLPSGPERLAASGNDWAEAVEEAGEQCRDSAADIACHYEWVTVEVQP